ncbi:putative nuclease HARBI1 [Ambystoma mexicanum]|uniref:putative nuclease HARBI1 n=1 Tax=Ambystoma mexicanum TaxID=8296 RepID=UPI0037E82653
MEAARVLSRFRGDSGYLQLPWLMTPLRNTQMQNEMAYNRVHERTRVTIERTFRLLKVPMWTANQLGTESWRNDIGACIYWLRCKV